ncbi:hypothetical protein Tco_0795232 [Tanacetum coccineum]
MTGGAKTEYAGSQQQGLRVLITDQKKVWWTHGNNGRRRSTILLKAFKMDYEEGCQHGVHGRHETFGSRNLGPFGMTTHRPLRRIRHEVVGRRKHWPFKRRKSCHGNLRATLAIIQTLIGGLDVERDQGCLNDDLESRARIDGSRTLLKSLEALHPYYKYKLVKYDGVELLDDKPVMDGLMGLDSTY